MKASWALVAATVALAPLLAAPSGAQGVAKMIVRADEFLWTAEPEALPGTYAGTLTLTAIMPLSSDEACVCPPTLETAVTVSVSGPDAMRDVLIEPATYTIHWWEVGPPPSTRGTHVQRVNVTFTLVDGRPGQDERLTIAPLPETNSPLYDAEGLPTEAVIRVPEPPPGPADEAPMGSTEDGPRDDRAPGNATTIGTLTVVEGETSDDEAKDTNESPLPAPFLLLAAGAAVALRRRRR